MNYLLNKSRFRRRIPWCLVVAGLLVVTPVKSQNVPASSQREESALTGAVVSSTRNTLVVRGENGQYHLFVFDRDTERPRTLTVGSTVRVVSIPGEEAGFRVAREITTLEAAAAAPATRGYTASATRSAGDTANRTRH